MNRSSVPSPMLKATIALGLLFLVLK